MFACVCVFAWGTFVFLLVLFVCLVTVLWLLSRDVSLQFTFDYLKTINILDTYTFCYILEDIYIYIYFTHF